MKKIILNSAICLVSLFFFTQAVNAQKWTIDKAHSAVKFSVDHLVISEVDGNFKSFDGSLLATSDDFSNAQINFTVDVNSINTENDMRDNHLKSDDFFNAKSFPQISFKSTSFVKVGKNKYELTGLLTIRDVTKKIKMEVTYGGTMKDPYGNTKAGFKTSFVIDRLEYGLKYNSLTETGGAVVGKDVTIRLNFEFAKAK